MRHRSICKIFMLLVLSATSVFSQTTPTHKDIVYASVEGKELMLDVYIPSKPITKGLLVWVHGGAWRSGTKNGVPKIFPNSGIPTASIEFRQSTDAKFPAQIHDIKAAIRFLRAKASTFGYNADKIVIAGSSSGGHLAALVGVTNGLADLEGKVGDHLKQSSAVQGILDYYGATNLTTILTQSTPFGLNVRTPALELLLGALPEQNPELAKLASPVFQVDRNDPPLLIFHGDQDPQMPINQSHELTGTYKKENLNVQFDVVYGAAHGGDAFYTPGRLKMALDFVVSILGK
ncbi:MAG: lipase [Marivirga sp.]|nr:lipase [Marivirga sp.]